MNQQFLIFKVLKLIKEINLEYVKVQLFEPELVRIEVTQNITIGKAEAIQITDQIGVLTNGKKYPVLMTGHEFAQVDKEGREYSASEAGLRFTIADAIIVKNLAQKILAGFYLRINKPRKPTRVFKNENEAIEWLYQEKINVTDK